ncbi:Fucose 4-O-acetylase [Saccharicrinis carchari]|uniref:Fucose 4-O-acetylase n=1 Tax=Saccharicrinis carchari TaxID=1168039 RepID=A0A521ER59_SACCC|nr:acyltransferase family protein [Saccharicrinis carchari]SMO86382.1 Fucose 4-O-acetylase [Saccharicrinis carchari]
MKRLQFIDVLRITAIFMVVYQHNELDSSISIYFESFSVSLFFMVSGFVSSPKSHLPFLKVLKKYIKHLLAPYFLISGLLYLFWFFVGRHYGYKATVTHDPLLNFIGIFYAQGGADFMSWGIPMWFLPTLFNVVMLDYFVSKLKLPLQIIALLLFPVIGLWLFQHIGFHLPWSFDIALVVYLFYFVGRVFKKIDLVKIIQGKELLVFIICFSLHLYTFRFNGIVEVYYGHYGDFLGLMYFNAILAFVWLFALLKVLPNWKIVSWLGRNTLPILAFHLLMMTFVKGVALFIFDYKIEITPLNAIFYTLLQIILLIPLIHFVNRYLPFLVGIDRKKDSRMVQSKAT